MLLQAGETFRIERSGTTLVSALGRRFALVTLEPATPLTATFAERFWDFWASLYVMPAHGPRPWL